MIRLNPKRSSSVLLGHPWVFAGYIASSSPEHIEDGTMVEVVCGQRWLGYGVFNSQSQIRVRMYSWHRDIIPNERFLCEQVIRSVKRRGLVANNQISATRLIHSEGDDLSGLVVDQFGRYLICQISSLAMWQHFESLANTLMDVTQAQGIYVRAVPQMEAAEGLNIESHLYRGVVPEQVRIHELGMDIEVPLMSGQKTGHYLDQSDNRNYVGKLACERRVLDLYCYTGGFALQALRQGAQRVVGVDSSAKALQQASINTSLNPQLDHSKIQWKNADAIEFVSQQEVGAFDLIIVDPPKFATSQRGRQAALHKYLELNRTALSKLLPDGLLVSCNCSGRVSYAQWLELLAQAASKSQRRLQIFEKRGPAPDHPISAHCPESDYLKCVVARVLS